MLMLLLLLLLLLLLMLLFYSTTGAEASINVSGGVSAGFIGGAVVAALFIIFICAVTCRPAVCFKKTEASVPSMHSAEEYSKAGDGSAISGDARSVASADAKSVASAASAGGASDYAKSIASAASAGGADRNSAGYTYLTSKASGTNV